LGGLQNIDKKEERSDIEQRAGSSGSNSQTPIERGSGNTKNRKDGQRPSQGPQNGTELDLDAISECLRSAVIIESLNEPKARLKMDILISQNGAEPFRSDDRATKGSEIMDGYWASLGTDL
jgi:hypothetical protein